MKVLFISHCTSHGGANLAMKEIIDEYVKRNIDVTVVFPKPSEWDSRYAEIGVKTLVFKYYRWVCNADFGKVKRFLQSRVKHIINMRAAKKVAKYVTENGIDIIHTNDTLTEVGVLASEIAKIPHVWHIREVLKDQFNLDFAYSKQYVKSKFAVSDKVIAISDCVKNNYKEYLGANTVRIYDAVNCGVPPENLGEHRKDFRILFAGGSAKAKGCKDILSALEILQQKGYNDIFLDFAGNVEKAELPEICDRLKNNITFLGMVKNLNEERAKCSVSVSCSFEAFGRVPAEALVYGMATVGPNVGAYNEVVKGYDNAFTYTVGNPESLAEKIEYIYNNRDSILKTAESNIENAQKQYSPERLVDELLDAYGIGNKQVPT